MTKPLLHLSCPVDRRQPTIITSVGLATESRAGGKSYSIRLLVSLWECWHPLDAVFCELDEAALDR